MCMRIFRNTPLTEADFSIATKSFKVYKSLDGTRSVHRWHHYFPLKIDIVSLQQIIINSSFNDVEKPELMLHYGFHSRVNLSIKSHSKYRPGKNNSVFVIPEGARYIKGEEYGHGIDNYVSDAIVYIGKRGSLLTWWRLFKMKMGWLKFKI